MKAILIFIIGIGVGTVAVWYWFKKRKCRVSEQERIKQERKEKILEYISQHGKVANNDVEKLVGVSDTTAERYLDELEKEGKIRQIGKTGRFVYYEKI